MLHPSEMVFFHSAQAPVALNRYNIKSTYATIITDWNVSTSTNILVLVMMINYWVTNHLNCISTGTLDPKVLNDIICLGLRGQGPRVHYWVLSVPPPCLTSPPTPLTPQFWMTIYAWVSGVRVQGSIIEYWVLSDPPPCLASPPEPLTLKPRMILYAWVSGVRIQGSIIEYWVLSDPPPCLTSPPEPLTPKPRMIL